MDGWMAYMFCDGVDVVVCRRGAEGLRSLDWCTFRRRGADGRTTSGTEHLQCLGSSSAVDLDERMLMGVIFPPPSPPPQQQQCHHNEADDNQKRDASNDHSNRHDERLKEILSSGCLHEWNRLVDDYHYHSTRRSNWKAIIRSDDRQMKDPEADVRQVLTHINCSKNGIYVEEHLVSCSLQSIPYLAVVVCIWVSGYDGCQDKPDGDPVGDVDGVVRPRGKLKARVVIVDVTNIDDDTGCSAQRRKPGIDGYDGQMVDRVFLTIQRASCDDRSVLWVDDEAVRRLILRQ